MAAPALTSNIVVNQAILYMGDNQPAVTGVAPTFDSSPAGQAAATLYYPCVSTISREFNWDFARSTVMLALSGNVAPFPWAFEYLYPTGAIELWQLMPMSLPDPNNPLPLRWNVGNNIVGGMQVKVIETNVASAKAVVNNLPIESVWDPLFAEAVVRLLASEMAMAIAGKPDTSVSLLEGSGGFEQLGEMRVD